MGRNYDRPTKGQLLTGLRRFAPLGAQRDAQAWPRMKRTDLEALAERLGVYGDIAERVTLLRVLGEYGALPPEPATMTNRDLVFWAQDEGVELP